MRKALLGILLGLATTVIQAAPHERRLAITIDDLDVNADDTPKLSLDERNKAILDALGRAHVKAALFVTGMRVDSDTGRRHLAEWSDQGHLIANHTYSHMSYAEVGFPEFSQDVLRGERVIQNYRGFTRMLRFPSLKEGNTAEKREQMREFMKAHEYRNGYVTIDASDWAIDARLRKRLRTQPDADLNPYRKFYLEHIANRADYYDRLTRRVLGHSVNHTLLIHHNLLQALFLSDLLDMLKARGWTVIDAVEAYKDPVFSRVPNTVPAGESIIWALAKESGRFEGKLRYPAEDGHYEDARMDKLGL